MVAAAVSQASILGCSAKHEESREIPLRLNRDFLVWPTMLRRLVVVFEQVRDVRKSSAFLKAFVEIVPDDAWASEKKVVLFRRRHREEG